MWLWWREVVQCLVGPLQQFFITMIVGMRLCRGLLGCPHTGGTSLSLFGVASMQHVRAGIKSAIRQ